MLKNGSFPQLAVNLCIPTIVIMLVMVIYNMADTYFMGKTGDPCKIAAVSLCAPMFSILSGLGTLLGSGGCTAVSLSLGKKEYDKIKAYTSLCCYGALAAGLLFTAAVLINAAGISKALGANEDTLGYTCTYLRIFAFGGPVILFGNVFNNLIRADGSAKQSMISNGLGIITNIILDPVLILGFDMGVAGAAAATVIGEILNMSGTNELISCCGSDCSSCYCYGDMCKGCNAVCGKVFHAPEGKECPIYDCCRIQNAFHSCGECEKMPCDLILGTRDPSMSEDEFMKNVEDRVKRLKG